MIRQIPFDDSIAETPHAVGNRLVRHGRNSGFAWQAASMRLHQNIADTREYSVALNADMQSLWYRSSSVLQMRKRAPNRPLRIKPKLYQDSLKGLIRPLRPYKALP